MKPYIRNYPLFTPFGEVETKVTLKHNFVAGFPEIEDIQPVFGNDDTDQAKADISEFIMRNFDLCSEQIIEIILEEIPEYDEFEPQSIF